MDELAQPTPRQPEHMSAYGRLCLEALAAAGLAGRLSVGGALGLLHYLDYRSTHDVDAWWLGRVTGQEQEEVLDTIETALRPFGPVRRRAWGDVVSIELAPGGKAVFSFKIAQRSVQLQPPVPTPDTGVLVDSLADLVASKMVALVESGAPRDFRDVYALCRAGLAPPTRCWTLWEDRQRLAGGDVDLARARLAIESHLARIAVHRPLAQIAVASERQAAERLRSWFVEEFLHAHLA